MLISFSGLSKSDCVFGSPSSSNPLRPAGTFVQVNLAQTWAGNPPISASPSNTLSTGSSGPFAREGLGSSGGSSAQGAVCSELAVHWLPGVSFGVLQMCLACWLTCKVLPPTCLISALLGFGYSFQTVADAVPFDFVNQSISFFRQCFYMKTKRNKKHLYFWVPSQVCGFLKKQICVVLFTA